MIKAGGLAFPAQDYAVVVERAVPAAGEWEGGGKEPPTLWNIGLPHNFPLSLSGEKGSGSFAHHLSSLLVSDK